MKKVLFYIAAGSLLLTACSSEPKKEETAAAPVSVVDSAKSTINEMADFKFHIAIANIPSPFETISELAKVGADFQKDLLNNTENETKYLTSTKKALNYGVYGVDLVYIATHKGNAQSAKYFKTAHDFAVSLDAAESFDKIAGSRLEGNWDNKDTVSRVMDEAFAATDSYLRNGERQLAATQILTGSWVESQYITLNVLKGLSKDSKSEFLYKKLYEQKLHLANLVDLLKEYEKEKDFKSTIDKLVSLNEEFKKIKTVEDISIEKVKELAAKIGEARELVVK